MTPKLMSPIQVSPSVFRPEYPPPTWFFLSCPKSPEIRHLNNLTLWFFSLILIVLPVHFALHCFTSFATYQEPRIHSWYFLLHPAIHCQTCRFSLQNNSASFCCCLHRLHSIVPSAYQQVPVTGSLVVWLSFSSCLFLPSIQEPEGSFF